MGIYVLLFFKVVIMDIPQKWVIKNKKHKSINPVFKQKYSISTINYLYEIGQLKLLDPLFLHY